MEDDPTPLLEAEPKDPLPTSDTEEVVHFHLSDHAFKGIPSPRALRFQVW